LGRGRTSLEVLPDRQDRTILATLEILKKLKRITAATGSIAHFRKAASKAKIIICSGQAIDHMPVQSRAIGVQGYLSKPYAQETLLRMVDRVLHDLF
jgi:DNA-binding NarL/FixJ family response regulator